MSASRRPTSAPALRSAAARLTATVDLPTPPLPDATAIVCFTPGRISDGFGRMKAGRTLAVMRTSTPVTPGMSPTRSCACDLKRSRTGQAGVVSSKVKLTLPCGLTSSSLIMPRLTTSRPRSGSWMWDSTSRICCEEGTAIVTACYRDSGRHPTRSARVTEGRISLGRRQTCGMDASHKPRWRQTCGIHTEFAPGSRRTPGGAHPTVLASHPQADATEPRLNLPLTPGPVQTRLLISPDMNGRAELHALQAACSACHVCADQGIIPEATPTFAGTWGAPFFLVGQDRKS